MKKLLLLFIMISSYGFGQEIATTSSGKQIILNSDKTWDYQDKKESIEDYFFSKEEFNNKTNLFFSKTIELENGGNEKKAVKLKVWDLDNDINNLDFIMFNIAILNANISAKYQLKNTSTYNPISIDISKLKGKWLITVTFSGQNGYGATKDGRMLKHINNDGSLSNLF